MKVLKFRAWDETTQLMIENYVSGCDSYGELKITQFHDSAYSDKGCPDLILEQYTGLKDENGKEIYEGDILEIGNQFPSREAVFFEKGVFRTKTNALAVFNDTCSVVGNIHTTPELLEET